MLVAFNTAVAESVFRNGANSGFVECRIAQWPDVGKNLTFRTHHYINVNCRRLAGAANALLEMGDDTACALGVSVERSRLLMMLVAVVLTAAATATAGPISFIALVAPHIARRISGTARWG